MKQVKTRAVWLAIGLVLGGGALSYAGVSSSPSPHNPKKPSPSVSATENEHETESDEPSENKDTEKAAAQRKHNHGYWVSLAAHCKDVSDSEDGVTIKAPTDCETNGAAHGAFVRQVAQSDAGKRSHPNHGNPTGKGGPK